MLRRSVLGASVCAALFGAEVCQASPWLAPGDGAIRSDVQLLADAGLITAPVNTWPLPWGEIARAIGQANIAVLNSTEHAALVRLQQRAAHETRSSGVSRNLRLALSASPRLIRDFSNTPREEIEAQAGIGWTGLRFTYNLQLTLVNDPSDDRELRLDGSYAGVALGNWMISAGAVDRWWGPGWGGSLILSTNARPVPAISINRNYADPLDIRFLRWVGPWTLNAFMGQLESDREVPEARLFGVRFAFRPLQSLEIGISRTAQWCGGDRPCDGSTFIDLLLGDDNRVDPENEPGNQLAGADVRWSPTGLGLPVAVYAQFTGDDEAGGLPSRYIGLLGGELWGHSARLGGSYRVYAEAVNTASDFYSDTLFDFAYDHFIYRTGYRYRGRSLGYGTDNDARAVSIGARLQKDNGQQWNALVQLAELNRGIRGTGSLNERNSIAAEPTDFVAVEVQHERAWGPHQWQFALGYVSFDPQSAESSDDDVRATVQWNIKF